MENITNVDWCFGEKTKQDGYMLYNSCDFDSIKKDGNKYTSKIDGYDAMVEFSDSEMDCTDDDRCSCEAYDHNGECKHVYALVCAINKVPKNQKIDFHIPKAKNEIDPNSITKVDWCYESKTKQDGYALYSDINFNYIKDNNKYTAKVDGYDVMIDFDNSYKDNMDDYRCSCEEYENNGECKHIYALVCAINKVPKNQKIDFYSMDKERKKNTVSYSVTINTDSILDLVDEKLASLDSNTLYKIREKLNSNNDDTSIIDKAISERNRRDLEIERINLEKERMEREERKNVRKALFTGLVLGLNANKKESNKNNNDIDLMPWEQEEVDNGNYEPYNFEEEELEEDDYYYEDDN